jgi:mRNA interferase MazF
MQRSEIWFISLDPTIGAEMNKTRPVVIVSSDHVGALPLKVVVPITDWKEHYSKVPWMTAVTPNAKNGLEKPSACDAFQVRSVFEKRFIRKLGSLDSKTMEALSISMADVLDIPYQEI